MRLVTGRTFVLIASAALLAGCGMVTDSTRSASADRPASEATSPSLIAEGERVFRFDTFGDEQLWTDTLRLHEVVEKSVDPLTALEVGFKVDSAVLPPGILDKVDLASPATTVALLKLNAIVGIQATVDANNHITRLGVTCAFCHSTVDDSVMPGIGLRQDGWPNRDLNVGAIIALSSVLSAEKKAVYATSADRAPTTTAGHSMHPRRPASTGRTPRARSTRRTVRHRCARSGSTRRTSTTAARQRWQTS